MAGFRSCMKFSLKLCKILLKVEWNFIENCVKFFWKFGKIFLMAERNFLKNWSKISLKLSKFFSKTEWNFLNNYWEMFPLKLVKTWNSLTINCIKIFKNLREILKKIAWNFK